MSRVPALPAPRRPRTEVADAIAAVKVPVVPTGAARLPDDDVRAWFRDTYGTELRGFIGATQRAAYLAARPDGAAARARSQQPG